MCLLTRNPIFDVLALVVYRLLPRVKESDKFLLIINSCPKLYSLIYHLVKFANE